MSTKYVFIVYHFYKMQPTGFHAECVFASRDEALAYIRRDPNIGTEKDFDLAENYAIETVPFNGDKC